MNEGNQGATSPASSDAGTREICSQPDGEPADEPPASQEVGGNTDNSISYKTRQHTGGFHRSAAPTENDLHVG